MTRVKKLKKLKTTKLKCARCFKLFAEPRKNGKTGRQKLFCDECFELNRLESRRKQDLKRMEERRSQKNRLRSGDREFSIDEHRITVRKIQKRKM